MPPKMDMSSKCAGKKKWRSLIIVVIITIQ